MKLVINLKKGDIIKCTVTGIESYGIFVKANEYTGLIHISEISHSFVRNIKRIVNIDDEIYALILDIKEDEKELSLSIKNINYLYNSGKEKVKQTKYGFYHLHENLPIWTEEKLKEIKNEKKT